MSCLRIEIEYSHKGNLRLNIPFCRNQFSLHLTKRGWMWMFPDSQWLLKNNWVCFTAQSNLTQVGHQTPKKGHRDIMNGIGQMEYPNIIIKASSGFLRCRIWALVNFLRCKQQRGLLMFMSDGNLGRTAIHWIMQSFFFTVRYEKLANGGLGGGRGYSKQKQPWGGAEDEGSIRW